MSLDVGQNMFNQNHVLEWYRKQSRTPENVAIFVFTSDTNLDKFWLGIDAQKEPHSREFL